MYKYLLPILILLAISASAGAQNSANSPLVKENSGKDGFSTHLAFELTTPTGSAGRWSTGGGASLTISYSHFITDHMFIAPGVGGFYNSMGTDFIPQYNNIYEGTVKNWGVRVPILLGYQLRLAQDLNLAFATGPLLNINLYAREQATPDFNADPIEPAESINLFGQGFNRLDLQWDFYVGLIYKQRYSVGFSAGAGITNVATMTEGQRRLNIRRNNFSFMLSYTF